MGRPSHRVSARVPPMTVGTGLGLILVGVWVYFANPAVTCTGPFACTTAGVEPIYPLAYLLLAVGAGLSAWGMVSQVGSTVRGRNVESRSE
jgi:hypothetical protein